MSVSAARKRRHFGWDEPIAARGHMPFFDHQTMAEVTEEENRQKVLLQQRIGRWRETREEQKKIEFGFDPSSLRPAIAMEARRGETTGSTAEGGDSAAIAQGPSQ